MHHLSYWFNLLISECNARFSICTYTDFNMNKPEWNKKQIFLMWSDINSKLLFWNGYYFIKIIYFFVPRHLAYCPHWIPHDKAFSSFRLYYYWTKTHFILFNINETKRNEIKRSMSIIHFSFKRNHLLFQCTFLSTFNPSDHMCTIYKLNFSFEIAFRIGII